MLGVLIMAYQTTMHPYASDYTEAWITYKYCLQSHEGHILPNTVQAS